MRSRLGVVRRSVSVQGLSDTPETARSLCLDGEAKIGWPWLYLVTKAVGADQMTPAEHGEKREEVCLPKGA